MRKSRWMLIPVLLLGATLWALIRGSMVGHNIIDDWPWFVHLEYLVGAGFVVVEAMILPILGFAFFQTLKAPGSSLKLVKWILGISILIIVFSLPVVAMVPLLANLEGSSLQNYYPSLILGIWLILSILPIPLATLGLGLSDALINQDDSQPVTIGEAIEQTGTLNPVELSRVTGRSLDEINEYVISQRELFTINGK